MWSVLGTLRCSVCVHNRRDGGARQMLLIAAQHLFSELKSERELMEAQALWQLWNFWMLPRGTAPRWPSSPRDSLCSWHQVVLPERS